MKIGTKILLLLLLLGTASCAIQTYPDDGSYPSTPYYRGYPDDYFNNRPGYDFDRGGERREHHERRGDDGH